MGYQWSDYDRAIAQVVSQMLGAADYFDENPDEATDQRLAAAFREYVKMTRAVPLPGAPEAGAR